MCARPDTRGYNFRDDWEKSLSVPSFDVSVKCAPGFAGNPKTFACASAPVVTRVRAVGSCGAKRVRSQAYPAAHPGVFHSVRKVGGGRVGLPPLRRTAAPGTELLARVVRDRCSRLLPLRARRQQLLVATAAG